LLEKLFFNKDIAPLLVGGIVGLAGGFGAVGFRELLHWAGRGFTWIREDCLSDILGLPLWITLPLSIGLGGLIVGIITSFVSREVRGHGVPEVISAVSLQRGIIRMRVVLTKAIASAICIGSGGSVGREGPIVQIGSAVGSSLGQILRVSIPNREIMVGCGSAAGIAATFNAPIAGVLFALEVILRDFRLRTFTSIVCASVFATTVSRSFFGDNPAFQIPDLTINHSVELVFYIVLGLLAGLVGVAFTRSLYVTEDLLDRLPLPDTLKPVLGGALVGFIALHSSQIMGVGYPTIERALHTSSFTLAAFFTLLVAKILATNLTLGSGGSGGIFAPSLFMGVMLGGVLGRFLQALFPHLVVEPGSYALVGMGALVAATTHAPLCSIVILFELTDDYKIILPLMLACIVSTVISRQLCRESIYTLKLSRRGELPALGPESRMLSRTLVGEILPQRASPTLKEDTPFLRILEILKESPHFDLPVLNGDNKLVGMVRFDHLKVIIDVPEMKKLVIAKDIIEPGTAVLLPTDSLKEAIWQFRNTGFNYIPVVKSREHPELIGVLSRMDLMRYYGEEIRSQIE